MADPTTAQLYLHTYGYRFRMRHDPSFSVFDLIEDARRRGFDGINMSVYGPDYLFLGGSAERDHLHRVRDALRDAGLGVDVESSSTNPDSMRGVLEIGRHLGAEVYRTHTKDRGDRATNVRTAIHDLRVVAPLAQAAGIRIALENHEDLSGQEVAHVLREVESPWIRGLFDYGNSVVFAEHPDDALRAMLPWTVTCHLKDQVVLAASRALPDRTLGVPIGDGTIPVRGLTETALAAGVRRICFESVWGDLAPVAEALGGASAHADRVFEPVIPDPDDARFCIDTAELERLRPSTLVATEKAMLDRSCDALARLLDDLPITKPVTVPPPHTLPAG